MLTHRTTAGLAVLALLAGLLTAAGSAPASAACRTESQLDERGRTTTTVICDDSTTTPVNDGGGNAGGGTAVCRNKAGTDIPCSVDGAWWSSSRNCYITTVDTPLDSPAWAAQGVEPGEGAFYRCTDAASLINGIIPPFVMFWLPAPPPLPPNPVDLAREALALITMRPGGIGITPPPGGQTLLGLPTWLWVADADAQTVGPVQTASASDQGLTVAVTAAFQSIRYTMGDGTTITCGPGTPYTAGYGSAPSPTCGHTYTQPGTYTISATAVWDITWTGAGQSGTLPDITVTGPSVTVRVAEAYGLVTGP